MIYKNKTEEIKERLKLNIKKLSWQDWGLIIAIILIISVETTIFSTFKHLPGPIYGGDLYRERGYTEHIIRGNSPLSDPLFINETNYFPWLAHTSLASFQKITRFPLEKILIYFPLLCLILISISLYLLGQKTLKNKTHAIIFTLLYLANDPIQGRKASIGLATICTIFFLLLWLKAEDKNKIRYSIYAGFFLGLASLFHGSIFINAFVFFASLAFVEFIWRIKKHQFNIKNLLKRHIITITTTISISLIFFGPLIAKYSLKTMNPSYAYALTDPDNLGVFWSMSQGLNVFFNFSSILLFVIGIISFLGLIHSIINFKKREYRFILALFFGTVLASAHYLITKPILNKWMEPDHMLSLMIIPSSFLFVSGIKMISVNLKKRIKKLPIILSCIVIIIIISSFVISITEYNNDRWVKYGKSMDPHTKAILEFGEWIKLNTNKEDVFLSNDETAFAINAISGAKVVMSRRVHASYFVDVDKRYSDGIVMLFGNNETKIKKLLKQYKVKYFYLDQNILASSMITNIKYKEYLEKNGIEFTIENIRLDPSSSRAPKFESLVIPAQNLTILKFTNPIKEVTANGQKIAILYKINE